MKKVLLVVVCALLSACALPALVKNEIKSNDNVVFEVPSVNNANGYYSGISFHLYPYSWHESNFRHERGASIQSLNKDQLKLRFTNAMISSDGSPIGSYKEYLFKVDTSTAGEITKVQFSPLAETIQPDTGIFKNKPLTNEDVNDAMALITTSGSFTFQFEVDSAYNTESIFANFKRLLTEVSHSNKSVEILGKQFKSSYLLAADNIQLATCYVSIYPYKNGSKAVVIATAKLVPDTKYHVDAGKQISEIKRLVTGVVNN